MGRFLLLGLFVASAFRTAEASGFNPFADSNSPRVEADLPVPRLAMPAVFATKPRSSEVVRGQNPSTFETPALTAPSGGVMQPFSGAATQDPFLYGPDPVLGAPAGPTVLSGVNGPQPYRLGFTPRFDYTYLGGAQTTNPNVGPFESHNFDFELAYVTPAGPSGWVLTSTPQLGARIWNGPSLIDLPNEVYRIGWDFTLATPPSGPWSMQFNFNPSVNTDFQEGLGNESLNLDGHAMLLYRTSPQLMFVLGAGYWDRVDGMLVPYAGVVWNPNDRWELRLLAPKARVSYFLGNFGEASHWLYATGEYHAESYQIAMPGLGSREQVQMKDYRVGVGLRSDHGWYDKSIEAGYVFNRNVEFKNGTPGFDIKDTFMVRMILRF